MNPDHSPRPTRRAPFLGKAPIASQLAPLLAVAVALTACSPTGPNDPSEAHEGHAHRAAPEAGLATSDQPHPEKEFCAEHGVPEAECGICQPGLLAPLRPGAGLKVRLPTAGSATAAGIQTASPAVERAQDGIRCLAELTFDQNRLAHIAAPVGGLLQSVDADLGNRVVEGQPVARIWSAVIAETVAHAVLTHQTLDRERHLRAERVSSQSDLQQAEASHRAACQQARTLGFSEAQIDAFGLAPDEPVFLEVRAPFAGDIVERHAVRGERVEPGRPLFTLVDRSTMWAMLSLPESDLERVHLGQSASVRIDAFPERTFDGHVTWIGAEVHERTRMAQVRVELPNPDGLLKSRMFGRARLLTGTHDQALLVPNTAIQRLEGKPFVFVALAPDLFEARAVRLGFSQGTAIEIAEGLDPAESIAVHQAFALKSHLLASQLGAGCAHE